MKSLLKQIFRIKTNREISQVNMRSQAGKMQEELKKSTLKLK